MWVRECQPNDPNSYHFPCSKQNSRKKEILRQSAKQPLLWERSIGDIFNLWDTKNTSRFSLRNQILVTLQSSSPMKSPKMKQQSWTQQSITESDSRMKAFLMRVHISNQLKPFSALTSTAVTHQTLKKAFSKEKLSHF